METDFTVSVICDFVLGVLIMFVINLLIDLHNRTIENNQEIHEINVKIRGCKHHKENV